EADSKKEVTRILEQHPEFTQQYLQENLYKSREELASELVRVNQDTSMQELYREVDEHFYNLSDIEKDVRNAFKYIKYHFPEFKVPIVYTMVSGFSSDLYISEDIVVIGLDYFLPSDHPFQPADLPLY